MSDKSKGFIQLILVVAFIAASFAISFMLQATKRPPQSRDSNERVFYVETKDVKGEPYRIEFQTTGVVQARANISITPQVSGRITEMNEHFFAGGAFKKDQTLFQIDIRDYQLEVERLQSQVAQAQTALKLEQAEAEAALKEWRQLNGKKAPPPLVAREPQLDEAKAVLKAAEAQLGTARLNLERASFSYPFDGRVLESNLETGQYVAAGQSYGEVFDVNSLEVMSTLEGDQLTWLLGADQVEITATFLGETKKYEGVISRTTSALNEETRFADFRFSFKEPPLTLLPGVFVNVVVRGMTMQDVGVLPASAMQTDGSIWVLKSDQTLERMEPEILYSDTETIAVRNFGDEKAVVTSRVAGATDGMKAAREGDAPPDGGSEAERAEEDSE